MKVNVINTVKTVSFCTTSHTCSWFIMINDKTIKKQEYSVGYSYWAIRTFKTLKAAVKYAKKRQYIPKNFKLKELQSELEVTING